MVEESQAALAWLKEKQELQAQLGAHEDPVLVSTDIKKKEDTLRRVADPILSEKPAAASEGPLLATSSGMSYTMPFSLPAVCRPCAMPGIAFSPLDSSIPCARGSSYLSAVRACCNSVVKIKHGVDAPLILSLTGYGLCQQKEAAEPAASSQGAAEQPTGDAQADGDETVPSEVEIQEVDGEAMETA